MQNDIRGIRKPIALQLCRQLCSGLLIIRKILTVRDWEKGKQRSLLKGYIWTDAFLSLIFRHPSSAAFCASTLFKLTLQVSILNLILLTRCLTEAKAAWQLRQYCMKQYFLSCWNILTTDKHSQPGKANRPPCSNVPHINSKKSETIQLTLLHFLVLSSVLRAWRNVRHLHQGHSSYVTEDWAPRWILRSP